MNNNNYNSNSWDNNKNQFDKVWKDDDDDIQSNDNNSNKWEDMNNDDKRDIFKDIKGKDQYYDSDTNIISSEKNFNTIPQYKKEANAWNSLDGNYYKYKYNDNSQDKYNNKKSDYKNNKGNWDKNKKRKYNENYYCVESNFFGWGTDQITNEEENKEGKKEKDFKCNSYEDENNIFNDKN